MPSDAARLEALGVTVVKFGWRDRQLSVPLRLEQWPLHVIQAGSYIDAVDILLDGQELGREPLIDDYCGLSDAMAEAVGVGRLPEQPPAPDHWFGNVPRLLRYLRDYEDDIASDLQSRWHVDYAQRWTGELSLRRIWSYIRRSEPTSALAVADNGGREVWTTHTFATARIWEALTGKPYEGRPFTDAEVAKAVEAMQRKQAEVDKLRSRRAHYHPDDTAEQQRAATPTNAATAGVLAAAQQAIANRQAEMGTQQP